MSRCRASFLCRELAGFAAPILARIGKAAVGNAWRLRSLSFGSPIRVMEADPRSRRYRSASQFAIAESATRLDPLGGDAPGPIGATFSAISRADPPCPG